MLQSANTAFNDSKQGHTNQRDQMLKDLAAAFDAYVELSANLQEGTKVCNSHMISAQYCYIVLLLVLCFQVLIRLENITMFTKSLVQMF